MAKLVPGVNDIGTTHPWLLAEMVDPTIATEFTAGSNKKLRWSCANDAHDPWWAVVKNRTTSVNPRGCPYCAGRLPVVGVTDLATTHPWLLTEMVDPSLATEFTAGSHKKVRWSCAKDDHPAWSAAVCHRTRTPNPRGCPTCATHGFDHSKPAWVYLLKSDLDDAYKVGLTNNLAERCDRHRGHGFGREVEVLPPQNGVDAQAYEKELKATIKQVGWKPARTAKDMRSGGFTETFKKSDSGELNSFKDLEFALLRRILAAA